MKLTIKPIVKHDEVQHQQKSSPKLTIKPIVRHEEVHEQQRTSPKLTIKPIIRPEEAEQQKSSPKLTIKPIIKPEELTLLEHEEQQKQSRSSPKIIIKPLVKPETSDSPKQKYSPKLTIKPVVKHEEEHVQQKCSPKVTIKPIPKREDVPEEHKTPKVTIKPICEPDHPKITIKPVVKPDEQMHSPKITIKPIVKPHEVASGSGSTSSPIEIFDDDDDDDEELTVQPVDDSNDRGGSLLQRFSIKSPTKSDLPKVTIKPIVKHPELAAQAVDLIDFEEQIKQERIILKINRSNLPSRKREHSEDGDRSAKLAKIKVKYSKQGGHAHIVQQDPLDAGGKHCFSAEGEAEFRKRFKLDDLNIPHGKSALVILRP